MNLVPFDGVAFLWFIGVLRDRLGRKEDRFFSTVFFGSGLLFLAMLFTAAAIIAAIIFVFATEPNLIINSATYRVTRTIAYDLMNVYAIKMAAVFMVSTSTVTIFTDLAPRWIAFLGFGLAAIILFVGQAITWSIFILPTWVFLISTYILIDNLWPRDEAAPSASGD
jgi:MFS family permease